MGKVYSLWLWRSRSMASQKTQANKQKNVPYFLQGMEIVQTMNSDPGLAVGKDWSTFSLGEAIFEKGNYGQVQKLRRGT